MKPQLKLLGDECPEWASVRGRGKVIHITGAAELPSGRRDATVELCASIEAQKVKVREREPRQWPLGCPERHINKDGSFCLGVGDPAAPKTPEAAQHWWRWLHEFILSQRVAERERIWPSARALHHGDAYKHQLRMEQLSSETPFEQDVRQALEARKGWLTAELPRLTRDGSQLVNLRAPCPRGCTRRQHVTSGRSKLHPILRRSCENRKLVFELVREEGRRREQEALFWADYEGHECCGTMDDCPLAAAG